MPLNQQEINNLVSSPSLSAVIYQAYVLIHELNKITREEYPPQACRIRDVFLSYVHFTLEQLRGLYNPDNPSKVKGPAGSLQAFGKILQKIYAYTRYLYASAPSQAHPAIQLALSQLTDLYFPRENGEPTCVVRPQWSYNLKCVPLSWQLQEITEPEVIDPDGELGITQHKDIFPVIWTKWLESLSQDKRTALGYSESSGAPRQVAVLSFAGLNTRDILLYPLLGHELGHFIDFSYDPPLYTTNPMHDSWEAFRTNIRDTLKDNQGNISNLEFNIVRTDIINKTNTCFRELLADLLATRMLGFSFFVAQAEFLKTVAETAQPAILDSGYPGIRFRLSVILNHLTADDNPNNVLAFLRTSTTESSVARSLISYLEEWQQKLESPEHMLRVDLSELDEIHDKKSQLDKIAEFIVRRTLRGLIRVAENVIPDDKSAPLTPRFFERVQRLNQELPPSCQSEDQNCFSEIMSASWAYQLLYGKQREIQKTSTDDRFEEYNKTCRLVLKAIELILPLQTPRPSAESEHPQHVESKEDGKEVKPGGVLSKPDIRQRVNLDFSHPSYLDVTPLDFKAIQAASLDVRLGHWFVFARRTKLKSVRIGIESEERLLMTIARETVFVPTGTPFLLHPGDLVLGCTLEFFALPRDLMAYVEGRSGLGRMGLIVATAAQVAPGFHGVIVLELANTGTVPLELVPGMSIAQIVFQTLTEPLSEENLYRGRYHCQITP